MIHGLQADLTPVWQSGTIPPGKEACHLHLGGKWILEFFQGCNNYSCVTLLSVPDKMLAHLLYFHIHIHLVKLHTFK